MKCLVCNKEFEKIHRNQKFCSSECSSSYRKAYIAKKSLAYYHRLKNQNCIKNTTTYNNPNSEILNTFNRLQKSLHKTQEIGFETSHPLREKEGFFDEAIEGKKYIKRYDDNGKEAVVIKFCDTVYGIAMGDNGKITTVGFVESLPRAIEVIKLLEVNKFDTVGFEIKWQGII